MSSQKFDGGIGVRDESKRIRKGGVDTIAIEFKRQAFHVNALHPSKATRRKDNGRRCANDGRSSKKTNENTLTSKSEHSS
jgi:hypothetical protein